MIISTNPLTWFLKISTISNKEAQQVCPTQTIFTPNGATQIGSIAQLQIDTS